MKLTVTAGHAGEAWRCHRRVGGAGATTSEAGDRSQRAGCATMGRGNSLRSPVWAAPVGRVASRAIR